MSSQFPSSPNEIGTASGTVSGLNVSYRLIKWLYRWESDFVDRGGHFDHSANSRNFPYLGGESGPALKPLGLPDNELRMPGKEICAK